MHISQIPGHPVCENKVLLMALFKEDARAIFTSSSRINNKAFDKFTRLYQLLKPQLVHFILSVYIQVTSAPRGQ